MRETLPLITTTTYLLDGSHHQLATVVCTVALALELAHGHQADSYLDRTLDGIEILYRYSPIRFPTYGTRSTHALTGGGQK